MWSPNRATNRSMRAMTSRITWRAFWQQQAKIKKDKHCFQYLEYGNLEKIWLRAGMDVGWGRRLVREVLMAVGKIWHHYMFFNNPVLRSVIGPEAKSGDLQFKKFWIKVYLNWKGHSHVATIFFGWDSTFAHYFTTLINFIWISPRILNSSAISSLLTIFLIVFHWTWQYPFSFHFKRGIMHLLHLGHKYFSQSLWHTEVLQAEEQVE